MNKTDLAWAFFAVASSAWAGHGVDGIAESTNRKVVQKKHDELLANSKDPASRRPYGDESLETAGRLCESLIQDWQKRGVKNLVIAFEGLGGFEKESTKDFYRWLAKDGVPPPPPKPSNAHLLFGTILPTIASGPLPKDTEYLVFPQDSQGPNSSPWGHPKVPNSSAMVCAREWMAEQGRKLFIMGHSFGGHSASELAKGLAEHNIGVNGILTVDPRAKWMFGKIHNDGGKVEHWFSYRQHNTPVLTGNEIVDAKPDVDKDLSSHGVGHNSIPDDEEVRMQFVKMIWPDAPSQKYVETPR